MPAWLLNARWSCLPHLPAEFGGFALEVVKHGVVPAAEPGIHVLDEVAEAVVFGMSVDALHGVRSFQVMGGHRCPPG